jgi:FAD synthetase
MRVIVFGTFDNLHAGHNFLLNEASARGDLFIVVARDKNVEHIKGKPPKQNEDERRTALQDAYPNAKVRLGDMDDYAAPLREIQPDLLIFGYDQELPPGFTEKDVPCSYERIEAFQPEKFKSSLQ